MQGAVNDGHGRRLLPSDYVKKDDARVIAHTKVIGGGESDSVTFDVSKLAAGQDYTYFCPSRPLRHDEGHACWSTDPPASRGAPSSRLLGRKRAFCRPAPAPYNDRSHDPGTAPHAGANMSKEK